MARRYHLTLLSVFSFLLLTCFVAPHLSRGKKVGKIVTLTVQYPAVDSPPGEKIKISAHYVDEHGAASATSTSTATTTSRMYLSLFLSPCDFAWFKKNSS